MPVSGRIVISILVFIIILRPSSKTLEDHEIHCLKVITILHTPTPTCPDVCPFWLVGAESRLRPVQSYGSFLITPPFHPHLKMLTTTKLLTLPRTYIKAMDKGGGQLDTEPGGEKRAVGGLRLPRPPAEWCSVPPHPGLPTPSSPASGNMVRDPTLPLSNLESEIRFSHL